MSQFPIVTIHVRCMMMHKPVGEVKRLGQKEMNREAQASDRGERRGMPIWKKKGKKGGETEKEISINNGLEVVLE